MKHQYEKFVLEAGPGIMFETLDGENGQLIIRAVKRVTKVNVYSKEYDHPPVPKGYEHVSGEWNNGFVIRRLRDGLEFVWVPVGSLEADGTLDGDSFTEKFGRRNYQKDGFSKHAFHEELEGELLVQLESVKKYGGFYVSRYNISLNTEGVPQTVKGGVPLVDISYDEAQKLAAMVETGPDISSHLLFGAEYDSVLAWLIHSGAKTIEDVREDSTAWGNHWNTSMGPQQVVETGSCEEWSANGIYDFAGNVDEWTQERSGSNLRAVRGGNYYYDGHDCPVCYRCGINPFRKYHNTGCRAALYIK